MGPPPPRGPPPMFFRDRNFGARRSAKALNYLKSCGVDKEHLKNLPRDLLEQIEPHYCGLCGHEFDTDALSRMHYLSKNHLKKMKKWVTNKPENHYLQNSKEIPFKSRDLYCELCDVHITSKVHAESHYAGKPHRAIVEGRKVPKNPFLLQNGMEGRLAQLIRREKKSLKNSDEAAKKMQEAEAGVSEPPKEKTVPPELYCHICDASVTCTEQMTMHLNGKRHLNKEKQHILKMMKGGGDNDNNTSHQSNNMTDDEDEFENTQGGNQDKHPISTEEDDDASEWPIEGEKWDYM